MIMPRRVTRFFILSLFTGLSLPVVAASDAPALQLHKWSGKINIPDPVAVTVDPQGRVYVTHTTRRKVGDLDIREFRDWIEKDVSLESIEEKRAFYHEVLAEGKGFKPTGSLVDHNKDGAVDWKDLTVHSEIIYRLEDRDGDGEADEMTVFADGFNTEVTGIAAGILYHDGWVYTTIAPDLWRLKDTDGDGKADIRESIVHGFGNHIAYAGHDMHGLTVGPDGRIYWTIGDKGTNVKTKEGHVVKAPHEGALLRCDPDGSNFEIFAKGLRNVQEIAFDDFGNIFGVDNDADKPSEKERLLYIVEGSDSGWRCGYQYMQGYLPWMDEGLTLPHHEGQPAYLTPALTVYHDGPAGFAFNPGTALGKTWTNRFFSNQFPSGKLSAFTVKPHGAGFALNEDQVVSSGVMGIGVSWHPDGSFFMADWMGGYPLDGLGAVWKVDVAETDRNPERQATLKLLQQDYSQTQAEQLLQQLAHEDQRVRRGAQFELVKRKAYSALQAIGLDKEQSLLARVHAIWGLGQGWRKGEYDFATSLKALLNEDQHPEILVQTLKVFADLQGEVSTKLGALLVPFLKHPEPRVAFQAGVSVGKLKVHSAFASLLEAMITNQGKDAYLRHAYVMGLVGAARDAYQIAALHQNASKEVRLSAVVALRRMGSVLVQNFLKDKEIEVQTEAARAIYDDESIDDALPALAKILDSQEPLGENEAWFRRILGANNRLGGKAQLRSLVEFALNSQASGSLRKEALTLVDQWVKPSNLDRVDGRYRKLSERSSTEFKEVLTPYMKDLLSLDQSELKTLAISILANHELTVDFQVAAAAVLDSSNEADLRAKTLSLLGKQAPKSELLFEVLDQILARKAETPLHITALELIASQAPEKLSLQVKGIFEYGSDAAQQKLIQLLGASTTSDSLEWVERLFKDFRQQKLSKKLALEVVEAASVRQAESPTLNQAWAIYQEELKLFVSQPSRGEFQVLLEGGDVDQGKRIVNEHLAANCIACHKVSGSSGSTVGPALNAIGKTRDREYLLRAMVEPNAEIASGFGMVTVEMKGGPILSGALMRQEETTLELKLPDGSLKQIRSEEFTSVSKPISLMPPMNHILSKREIRDVVAFLSSLKPKERSKK